MARRSALLAACAVALTLSVPARADAGPGCQVGASAHWQRIGTGVWVWPGAAEDINPRNRGHVASQILVAQGPSATLIDPGPGLAHGLEVLRSARCELGLGITRVLDSHAHAENVLGNAAFVAAGTVTLAATATTRAAMAQRCESCRASIARASGDPALGETPITLPQASVQAGQRWNSDAGDWLTLEFGPAHSESDLAWWNESERLLIAPSLLYQDRLPELAQGSLQGWIAALRELERLPALRLVGNRPMSRAGLASTLAYLCGLERSVLQALESGLSAAEATRIGLQPLADPERHGFNLQRAWRELEPRWIRGLPPACPA